MNTILLGTSFRDGFVQYDIYQGHFNIGVVTGDLLPLFAMTLSLSQNMGIKVDDTDTIIYLYGNTEEEWERIRGISLNQHVPPVIMGSEDYGFPEGHNYIFVNIETFKCFYDGDIFGFNLDPYEEGILIKNPQFKDELDLFTHLKNRGMTPEQIEIHIYQELKELSLLAKEFRVQQLANEQTAKSETEKPQTSKITDSKSSNSNPSNPWLEQAITDLFNGDWLSLNGSLYRYNGKYYDCIEDGEIKRDITNWCRNYTDENGKKSKVTPTAVDAIFKWANQTFYISPNKINSDGLPLANGILKVTEINGNINVTLKPHSPSEYFTFCSDVSYNPTADITHANTLLECLDTNSKSLLLQTLSCILNFPLIRKKRDRIKALMLIGEGSNGKDTLRNVLSLILGNEGMTNCSLNDFKQADTGRGFNLKRLETNPKVNWSSENSSIAIDKIQCLKQAITGDPIFIEGKGKDGIEIELNTIFIFNANETPVLKGNQKAIESRFSLIPFTKVYSTDPESGELQADPRFKHDREFLVNDVCPAILNLLIDSFKEVYSSGINYSVVREYVDQVKRDNNHLLQFCSDTGLTFTGDENDFVTAGEIYQKLDDWYLLNKYYEIDESGKKPKKVWLDCGDKSDPVIKANHQLTKRIKELFPKVKDKMVNNRRVLVGLTLKSDHSLLTHTQQDLQATCKPTNSLLKAYFNPTDHQENIKLEKINPKLEKINSDDNSLTNNQITNECEKDSDSSLDGAKSRLQVGYELGYEVGYNADIARDSRLSPKNDDTTLLDDNSEVTEDIDPLQEFTVSKSENRIVDLGTQLRDSNGNIINDPFATGDSPTQKDLLEKLDSCQSDDDGYVDYIDLTRFCFSYVNSNDILLRLNYLTNIGVLERAYGTSFRIKF